MTDSSLPSLASASPKHTTKSSKLSFFLNNCNRAKLGHPTIFLKVLHYALFGASQSVKAHLFAKGVDPDTIHLNDMKFFKTIVYILVSSLNKVVTNLIGQSVLIQMQSHC